jgi:hypothetical protein
MMYILVKLVGEHTHGHLLAIEIQRRRAIS